MPKTLFYAGVVFTLLAALMVGSEAWGHWTTDRSVIGPERSSPISLLLMMFMIGPIGAIVLRIYAFLFARDLFASLSGMMLTGAAMTTALGVLVIDLQLSIAPDARLSLAVFEWLAFYLLSFLCVLMLIALRPYLRLRSPIAAALVVTPGPLFIGMIAQDFRLLELSRPVSGLYLASMASCLAALGFHALRHRHTFVEPTDLRDMMHGRWTRPETARGGGFGIGQDAAFDG